VRRFVLFGVAAGVAATTIVAFASASQATQRAVSITPTAETAYPWLAPGVTPAGTADNNWQEPNGDLFLTNYSMLKQLNTSNVSGLHQVWQASFGDPASGQNIQGAPIVVSGKGKNLPLESGTMFLSENGGLVALNPVTGKTLWKYVGAPPISFGGLTTPASRVAFARPDSRTETYAHGNVFVGNLDGTVTSLNAKTGAPVWTAEVSAAGVFAGHAGLTSPFTTYYDDGKDGLIITAPNQGDSPLRGHLDAYNSKTGALAWRFWTTPDPTQFPYILTWANPAEAALGGNAIWNNPSVDPQLGLAYTGTGNAYPYTGRQPGKDLWTSSLIAVDLKTGALRWYYQAVHHDMWDYDCPTPIVLFNMTIGGKLVPGLAGSCKTAFIYELDRRNGHPIFPIPEVKIPVLPGDNLALNNTWPTQPEPQGGAAQIVIHCPTDAQAKDGIPSYPLAANGTPIIVAPGTAGGASCMFPALSNSHYIMWGPYWGNGGTDYPRMSFDPQTNDLYVCAINSYMAQENAGPADYHLSTITSGTVPSSGQSGTVSALNMTTNKMDWQIKYQAAKDGGCYSGVVTTAGGLAFVASRGVSSDSIPNLAAAGKVHGGTFYAYNAKTGEQLWSWQAPDEIHAPPITYSVNGKQYVSIYVMGPAPGVAGATGQRDLLTTFSL
jgi:quinohemoprotein ethanol dehydrogenase